MKVKPTKKARQRQNLRIARMLDLQSKLGRVSLVQGKLVGRIAAGDESGWQFVARVIGRATNAGTIDATQLEGHTLEAAISVGLPDGQIIDVNLLPSQLGGGSSAQDGNGGGESETHLEIRNKADKLIELIELCERGVVY